MAGTTDPELEINKKLIQLRDRGYNSVQIGEMLGIKDRAVVYRYTVMTGEYFGRLESRTVRDNIRCVKELAQKYGFEPFEEDDNFGTITIYP